MRFIITSLLTAMILTGCVSTRANHGYIVEFGESGLDAMEGIDSKESILARFGEPSIRPPLNDDTWYYISQKTNARAFFQTEVYERQVVAFRFDDEGLVSDVVRLGLEDGTDIDIVGRTTATRGKELSLLEQLLGGVGQVATPGPAQPGAPVP